ncbi:MAG TPA: DNA helicase RecQ [Gemmataceae bacterium]|nr:DNA helicase RecQ [Gemmataceae bacterium]
MPSSSTAWSLQSLKEVIARHWGFSALRPLQEQAMGAVLEGRDSLVVLPTGGGKSLCYQAPAVLRGDITVVVSPLISLMKDQVDSLKECGVSAIQLNSSQSPGQRGDIESAILQGTVRLLFVSPERLVHSSFQSLLRRIKVRSFAIDEAHCISHWGHDFRPEYRQLNRLKELFPDASLHGYTATATERVRRDIIEQLGLKNPEVLVGNFDRPNLNYRVLSRRDLKKQVREVLDRHKGEAGIIYCIKRNDVDDLTALLQKDGYHALPYHAGMDPEKRKQTQDAFAAEKCDLVVATVAFGMGIDRSNIRFVLHTGMPKSVEHYQQETGRAGRDNLEAECVLLHSGSDFMTWKWVIEKSAAEPGVDAAFLDGSLRHLRDINGYCRGAVCRHRALVEYFGQKWEASICGACDLCLEDTAEVADSLVIAQKILSCVARVKERFGMGHVISVLRGENTENIRKWGHESLSTFGLMKDQFKADLHDWIYQLLSQGVLEQEGAKFPVLRLNPGSWEVMKGQRTVRLLQPVRRKKAERPLQSRADTTSWEGVDRELFEVLRGQRRVLADEKRLPPYFIFSDATLRELARVRPTTLDTMREVYGIGEAKLMEYGQTILKVITQYGRDHNLTMDNVSTSAREEEHYKPSVNLNLSRETAFDLFAQGAGIDAVMQQTQRKRSTVLGYLSDWIRDTKPASIENWVSREVYERVAETARQVGTQRLKPIFLALEEKVSYDEIRLIVAHLGNYVDPR